MADKPGVMTFQIEDAQIVYRNFSGAPTPFDSAGGKRTFCVVLSKELADQMAMDGWNVKCKPARDIEDEEFCFIEVTVRYDIRPPKIVLVTNGDRQTILNEQTVGTLDWADIQNVDLIARSHYWEVGDKTGIKAYLKSMFVTIEEDALERKYGALTNDPVE